MAFPWLAAARERDVLTPLVDAGLTKQDVRSLSAAMGLPTADKPASPCLSSRLAYGVRVTPERLARVDAAEDHMRALGFEVFRVRDHGDVARIEVPPTEIARAAELAGEIAAHLTELGFRYVSLDLDVLEPKSFFVTHAVLVVRLSHRCHATTTR